MKYWAYVNNEILGPYEMEKLLQLPAFSPSLLVCPQTPVGEKTEDWKEASGYPEVAAAIGKAIPGAAPAAAPAADAQSPSIETAHSGHDLKALTPAPVDPVPPKETSISGISLEVNHLERSGRMQSPAAVSSVDPISLSSIGRKTETLSAQHQAPQPQAGPGIELEPQHYFSASAPAAAAPAQGGVSLHPILDIGLPTEAPAPAPSPQAASAPAASQAPDPTPAPAAASTPAPSIVPLAAPAAFSVQGIEDLVRRLDAISQNSVSRQDLAALTDPMRQKLDQMGEVLSSIKNSQFQREVMDKLAYLESALGEIKSGPKPAAGAPAAQVSQPAPVQAAPMQPAQTAPQQQPKPAEDGRKTVVVDMGSQASPGRGKKGLKIFMALLLLGAAGAGAFFVLQGRKAAAPAEPAAEAAPALEVSRPAEPTPPPEADKSPEAVYLVRQYTAAPGGPRLEDKIAEIASASGGTYSQADWQAKKVSGEIYEAVNTVKIKKGALTFTFAADMGKKAVTPADSGAKAAIEALARKPSAGARRGRAAAAKPAKAPAGIPGFDEQPEEEAAPAARPAKAAKSAKPVKKIAAPEEEYEYEYDEE
jgi:hypothetical protein